MPHYLAQSSREPALKEAMRMNARACASSEPSAPMLKGCVLNEGRSKKNRKEESASANEPLDGQLCCQVQLLVSKRICLADICGWRVLTKLGRQDEHRSSNQEAVECSRWHDPHKRIQRTARTEHCSARRSAYRSGDASGTDLISHG